MITLQQLATYRALNKQAADSRVRAAEAAELAISQGLSDAIRSEIAEHHALAEKLQRDADLIVQEMMTSIG